MSSLDRPRPGMRRQDREAIRVTARLSPIVTLVYVERTVLDGGTPMYFIAVSEASRRNLPPVSSCPELHRLSLALVSWDFC